MSGIARVVSESSQGYNVPQPVRNTITGELEVHTYDWVSLFHFKTIPNILQYHVFRVDASNPKVAFLKEYSTEAEVSHAILETTTVVDPTVLPSEIVGKGLNLERQWYLYEKFVYFATLTLVVTLLAPSHLRLNPKVLTKMLHQQVQNPVKAVVTSLRACLLPLLLYKYLNHLTQVPRDVYVVFALILDTIKRHALRENSIYVCFVWLVLLCIFCFFVVLTIAVMW